MKFIAFFCLLAFACTTLSPFQKEANSFWKTHQKELYSHDRAPLKKADLKNLRYYKADEQYRTEAVFSATPDAVPFEMNTVAGITKTYVQYGTLAFTIKGNALELAIYQSEKLKQTEEYKNHLFLPFKDATSGVETYGGGRYIDLETTDIKNGRLILDFNKAYNPWCAYSDGYSCPIPPLENHMTVGIYAGEKTPKGH